MRSENLSFVVIASLVEWARLALFVIVVLPCGKIKAQADALRLDGILKFLSESNVLVFKLLLGLASLLFSQRGLVVNEQGVRWSGEG